jgi:hypothetical protein
VTETSWDEVGRRFNDLGRHLQAAWGEGRSSAATGAGDELRDAGDKVRAALDDLADTITRSANDPEVRDAARSATSGVAEALAATLRQAADHLDRTSRRD